MKMGICQLPFLRDVGHLYLIIQALHMKHAFMINAVHFPYERMTKPALGVGYPNTYIKFPCVLDQVFKVARLRMTVPRPCIM